MEVVTGVTGIMRWVNGGKESVSIEARYGAEELLLPGCVAGDRDGRSRGSLRHSELHVARGRAETGS